MVGTSGESVEWLMVPMFNTLALLLFPFAGSSLIRFHGSRINGLSPVGHSDKMAAVCRELTADNKTFDADLPACSDRTIWHDAPLMAAIY